MCLEVIRRMYAACTQVIFPSSAFLITSCLVMALLSRATRDAKPCIALLYRPPDRPDIFGCLWQGHLHCSVQVGFNLYRDGRDSVAWHGDHIDRAIAEPIVPLVSLGEPRKLLFRPKGGGPSRAFLLGRGDLLVTGGTTQRTWEHAVPKVARAGPRISIAFRYRLASWEYARQHP
jgi:alkylated DNA repair dioxygenase AlkB